MAENGYKPAVSTAQTTTVSTIAVQSGDTNIVIALLKSGEWFHLKMLEAIPALTSLGDSLEEATQLQKTHEDVIMKIQSKQSPTEELLRKADQLIASQRPRPEVYAAMAESLSQAWEDVIKHLMRRRDILNLNVSYQSRAKIYFERVRALELLCSGSPIPDNVELIRENLEHLQEVKRAMLESLMSTLQEGEVMLETLRIVANEKRDSRPDGTRTSSLLAISQVEHWIEQLHDQRHLIEQIWARRRTLLEQSLALSLLATDLTLLESLLFDRHETLSRLKNNLGSSETEVKSLLESLQSLLPEAKELQEQSLKVLRAGEQLLMGGHPVNADSSKRGYSILQSSAEYIQELQGREELLNQAIQFYQSANNVFAELDKLQVEIDVQRQIDVSVIERLNQTTNEVIAQGRLILKEAPGAEGIKKVLEEIENRKVNLSVLYQEEHIKISELLNSFLEKQNELYSWLINDPDTFVRSNKDVGHSDIVARNQLTSHLQLLEEMQGKGCEINSLLMSLPHDFLDRLNSEQKLDVTTKIEELHKLWVQLKNVLERRVSLLSAFIRIYSKIQTVLSEFDSLESDIKVDGTMDDANFRTLREYWATTEAHFQELRQEETNFRQIVNESRNVYLDVDHAQQRIDALIKELTSRETRLSTIFSTIEAQICEHRKRIGDLWQQNMADSSKTMDWVSKLDSQLYPIINEETTTSDAVVTEIENKLNVILPEVKRTQSEIEARIQTAEALVGKGEAQDAVPPRLRELNEKLLAIISDYQNLADMLIKFFKNLSQVEETVIKSESNYNADSIENNLNAVDLAIDDHDSLKQSISECFRQSHSESVKVINQIKQQEPESAGERDISCIRRLLDMKRSSWERNWAEYKVKLEQKQQLCQFDTDLANINHHLDDLSKQLITIRGQYGESLSSAKSTSLAFLYFEKTVQLLEQRIETFITAAEAMLNSGECNSDHINEELGKLKKSREAFLEEVNKSRHLIDLSIQYFQLVEEAQEWFREGSKLLIMIARKTSEVERPDEINQLLEQIELFLKPEEVRQEERLDKISQLAAQIFGEEKPSTVEQMTSESQELVESFQSVCKELEALGDSYRKTEEMKMELDETVQKPSEISEENEHSELTIQEVDEEEEKEIQVDPIQESPPDERIEVLEKQDRKSPSPPPPEKKAKFNEEEKLEPPVFTEPLVPCTVQEGEKFILECRITGSPTPKIKWLKDNLSIENNPDYLTKFEDGICTLTIEETFAEDSAQFTCVATNEAGSVSTSAVLSVTEVPSDEHISAPEFVKPLQNTVTKEGEELELSCQVTGNPLPTVQWYKDDVCIDNSSDYVISYNNGEAILKLEKTTENDCGKYSCKATNASGSSYSHASVSVESKGSEEAVSKAPRFISPLSNVMARAGQKIKLECEVEGEPHPELIWIHNDKVIPETRDVQFFHDGNKVGLTINEAFPKDAGVYRLLAKNLSGEASCSCTAAVKGIPPLETSDSELASDSELVKPVIKMPLKDATVVEGEKAQLDCIIVAQPEPEVIWYFEGKPVKESSDLQLIFAGDRCTLVIDHVSQEDSGEYEVVAINSAGEISSSCSLSVQSPEVKIIEEPQGPESTETIEVTETVLPKFNKLLDDILTREGDSVSLEVSISAQPAPTVRWYLNNAEIAPSSRVQISEDADGTHKLYITDVKPEDRGVYTVKAINSLGEVKCFSHLIVKENTTLDSKPSSDIQLEEKLSIPAFIEMFSDKTVPVEGSVKFECKVVGKPAPKIKWYFNNEPVSGSNFLVSTSGDRQILTIPEVRTEDQGKISCIAENEAGKTSCDAHLIVEDIGRRLELFPAPGQTMDTSSESYSYEMKRSLFSESSSIDGCAPTQQIQSFKSLSESGMKQSGSQPPLTMESLETEEYQNINGKESHHQSTKSSSNFGGILEKHESYQSNTNLPNALSFPKPIRKQTAPRFVSTLMGKIVDQGSNVALEGIIDGFPSPNISWSKNGVEVYPIPGKLTISWSLNKASLEISDVNLQDAGRYTCKAENDLGSATCTADIVVKKNVFSPIIGRRLQSQTVPTNERVILEVEVTGQPEPTVTWYKDNLEIPKSSGMFRFRSQGNSHALIIDKVSFSHGGQYTVKTKNEAGESSSSASVYVFEPPPSSAPNETVIETKLSGDWSAPSSTMQSTWQNSNSHPTQSISQFHEESKSSSALSESVFVSETVKRDKQVVIKLSNESQPLAQFTSPSKPIEPTPMFTTAVEHKPIEKPDFMTTSSNATEETTIEDQSITKRSALDFFKNIIKENETGSSQEKYESSTKSFSSFSEPVKETPKPSFSSSVPVLTSLPSPYVNKSYESFSESSSSFMKQTKTIEPFPQELKLEPGPPPEIGYIPKVTAPRPKPDMLSRVRKIEESQRELSPIEIPSGGVKIFPTISRKNSSELQQKFSERVEQKSVQASAYQKTPTYQNPPTYQSTLAYQNTSAYQSPPAYQSSSAFQSTAAYQSPPAYQSTPAYQSSPSHQSTSAYQTTPFSENVPPKSFKTEERKEVIEEAFVKKKVEFSGSQDATFLQQTQPAPFPNVDQKVKDHLPILRPQAENITLRPSSPRPSAEGISMEKLWSSKHKEESSTVLGEPIMRPASPIKRTPSPVKRTPSPVKRASSPYLSPTKVAPFSNLANASPQPFKSAAPAPSYFSPQPRAASPPPAFLSPQSQRVSSPIPSFVSSQMSASWYGSELKRAVSPRPSAEGVAMEKLWSRPHSAAPLKPTSPVFPKPLPYETKTPIQTKPLKKTWPPAKSPQEEVTAPWSNRVVEQSSTCEAIPGGYRAESKSFCSEQTKSVGKPAFSLRAKSVTPSFTSEKREMMSSYSSYSSSTTYNSSGSTNQTIQHTEPTPQSAFQPFHSQSPAVVEEKILKPSEAKKSWPPGKPSEPDYVPKKFTPKPVKMFQPPVTEVSLEALHLEPGPPPVLAYAEPPQNLRRQSYVEVIEEGLEKDIEKGPSKCLLGAVRTIPPPPSSKETAESQKENVHSSYQESRFSETHDQKVAPPWIAHTKRPLSVEIPPNQFSYSATSRQLRPVSCHMDSYAEMYSEQMYKSSSTQYSGALPNSLQPSSPPEYCNTFSSTTKVETKPKKSFQSDGYMADTDEPRHLLKQSNFSESNWQQRKYATLPASTKAYKKGATSFKPEERTVKLQDLNLEPFPFQPEPAKPARKQIVPPPASPSKFIKGDFRQSEYGTDYESVRIPPIWKPHDSDSEDISYRPVRPNLTPVSRRKKYENNVLPPLNFEDSPRSKFEPEKSTTPVKLKEILSPIKMQKSFPQSSPSNSYQTFASQPTYQNQSHQAQSTYQNQSHQVQSTYQNQSHQAQSTYQQMHQNHQNHSYQTQAFSQTQSRPNSLLMVKPKSPTKTTPTYIGSSKLAPTESSTVSYTESTETSKHIMNVEKTTKTYSYDHGSESRSQSTVSQHSIPFDSNSYMAEQKRLERVEQMRKRFESSNDITLQPGEPPEFVLAGSPTTNSVSNEVNNQMQNLNNRFKSKVQKFTGDIISDVNRKDSDSQALQLRTNDVQSYKQESRNIEHGSKQIDPSTGLVYFKYDFGYEFGVVTPNDNSAATNRSKPKRQKSVTWDPMSESEFSGNEARKRSCLKSSTSAIIPYSSPSSPVSPLSSLSPNLNQRRHSAGTTWGESRIAPEYSSGGPPVNAGANRDLIQKPPFFTTPLRDIAVVKGQSARFECIVQGEPTPQITWLKDTAIIEASDQYDIQFRNGVCRLTLPQAYSYDAGLYRCSANNAYGTSDTSATLTVSGENRRNLL